MPPVNAATTMSPMTSVRRRDSDEVSPGSAADPLVRNRRVVPECIEDPGAVRIADQHVPYIHRPQVVSGAVERGLINIVEPNLCHASSRTDHHLYLKRMPCVEGDQRGESAVDQSDIVAESEFVVRTINVRVQDGKVRCGPRREQADVGAAAVHAQPDAYVDRAVGRRQSL